jgi:hypothetical protein
MDLDTQSARTVAPNLRGTVKRDYGVIEQEYEVDGRKFILNQTRISSRTQELWFDLLYSGFDLSEVGETAARNLIESYARQGEGYRRIVNGTHQLMYWGNSIVFNCYTKDVADVTQQLLSLVSNTSNLLERP